MSTPTVDVSGLAFTGPDRDDFRTYHPNGDEPTTAVIDRFIQDGRDGSLKLHADVTVPGRTETVVTVEGTEDTRPYTITRILTAHIRSGHGVAIYEEGDAETGTTWRSHTATPTSGEPFNLDAFDYPVSLPADAALPTSELHAALREFATTAGRPTVLTWRPVAGGELD